METTDVVIAGAGPVGLTLARELRLAGIGVVIIDALSGRTGESRAGALHPRTMEMLDQRGILDGFIAEGTPRQVGHFAGIPLDFSDFATRYPYSLFLLQSQSERILEHYAAQLDVVVRWSTRMTDYTQDCDGVTVVLDDGSIRASYLVGCDGGRSTVRRLAGIEFPGTEPTVSALLADMELGDPPEEPVYSGRTSRGTYTVFPFGPGTYRMLATRFTPPDSKGPVSFAEFRDTFVDIAGTDYGMRAPIWISRYSDSARQASRYRQHRVLLAGDAAHVHYPAGGQGLNLGVQDAFNLGWRLAAAVCGADTALDCYEEERHPVAARVLDNTRAQSALSRPGPQTEALRATFSHLTRIPDVNRELGLMIAGLDVDYGHNADDHQLVGRRMPDMKISASAGQERTYDLLRAGKPVLLCFGPQRTVAAEIGESMRLDAAKLLDIWVDAVDGQMSAPAAVLVRPDGHIAWATDDTADLEGLEAAVARSGFAAQHR